MSYTEGNGSWSKWRSWQRRSSIRNSPAPSTTSALRGSARGGGSGTWPIPSTSYRYSGYASERRCSGSYHRTRCCTPGGTWSALC